MSGRINAHEQYLPKGWRLVEIGKLVTENQANLQTGPFGTMLLASEYKQEGTPVVAVKNIGNNEIIYADNDIPRVDEETRIRLSRYSLKKDDILFGRKGAVDRCALVSEHQEGWLQGSDCIRLRFMTSEIDAKYVSYYLGSPQHTEWILAHSVGSTMSSLNQSILSRISFLLPPLEEQRKIAAILSTWDEAIGLVEQLIAALGRRKQALMQLLLTGAVRFAGFEGEWEEVAVSEFVQSSIAGEWGDEPDSSPETLPVIRSTNFTNDGYLNLAKIAYRKIPSNKIDKLLINVGDILLEKSGGSPDQPVGRVVYFNESGKFVFANFIQRLVIEENFHPKTILYMLIRYYRSGKIEQFQQQTTGIRNFRLTDFMKEKIRMPRNYQEQVKIAELLTECDQEIEYANTLKVAYQEQKRGLMQQLLTGAVRV